MERILIVDDEKMIVNSLVLGYGWKEKGCEVVGTASGGREALELIGRLHPDIVFTDIRMPGMTGLELMTAALKLSNPPQFVVISGYAEFTYAQQALSLGAAAYCLKPLEDEEIDAALQKARNALAGASALANAAATRFLASPTGENAAQLLSLCGVTGHAAVCLSAGRAEGLFSGAGCRSFQVMEGVSLHLLPGGGQELESFGFNTAMLAAVSAGTLDAWVYDETDNAAAFLSERLSALSAALFAGWFPGRQSPLGRVPLPEQAFSSFTVRLAELFNNNRPADALQVLTEMTEQDENSLSVLDALRLHNLCTALLCRLRGQSQNAPLRYGWELASLYPTFREEKQFFCQQLGQVAGRVYNAETLHNETLQKIVTELNRDFATDVSFQDVCTRHHINPSYLSQLFKKELGVTFTAYVNNLRISYAKELLEKTSLLVSEIGDKVGFENYLTFTKLFKRETGITPKQYRQDSQR